MIDIEFIQKYTQLCKIGELRRPFSSKKGNLTVWGTFDACNNVDMASKEVLSFTSFLWVVGKMVPVSSLEAFDSYILAAGNESRHYFG